VKSCRFLWSSQTIDLGAYRGILFFLIATTSFTVVNVLVKKLGGSLPVHELVFFRSIFSLVYCLFYLRIKGINPLGNNQKWLAVRGVFGTGALLLFFYTLVNMPLASATTIQYLSPIFTIILAIFINGQKVKPWQWLFFSIAFIGVVLIKGFDARISVGLFLIAIAAAVGSGIAYNAVIKCKETEHPMVTVFWFPLIATPIVGVWCFFDWQTPQGIEWVYVLAMGVFTQIAQWFMTLGLQTDLASRVTPVNYIGSIYAVAIGYWMFNEVLGFWALIGIGLVLAGVLGNTLASQRKSST